MLEIRIAKQVNMTSNNFNKHVSYQQEDFLGRLLANLNITSHGDNRREIKHYGKMLHTL